MGKVKCPQCGAVAGIETWEPGHHEIGTTESGESWIVECGFCGQEGWREDENIWPQPAPPIEATLFNTEGE